MTENDVVVTATIEAVPGKEVELAEALRTLCEATVREPGCRMFQVMRVRGQPGVFVLWEHFADQAAFDAHMAMEHTKAYFARGLARETRPVRHEPLFAA
ncbi:putative quinol monooxygenase [Azospirillum sp.]|uniref:putative quinol monooxygenase n=1 Tax=Azospirillum sp. TaxID=34012 RepID=UPI002D4300B4|nr:putative quinol monooxygenase [Azospirillum sp.]HYD68525.1 putative quinol monooxygenase [Azospirillum sp.]